jgi:hypothetical protein
MMVECRRETRDGKKYLTVPQGNSPPGIGYWRVLIPLSYYELMEEL